jgi:nitrite reductase/ring-hydroxylating ferredoxin subunit
MEWQKVASAGDVPDDAPLRVELGRLALAIYRIGGKYYATDDVCTHEYACLSDGYLEGEYIECPLHQGRFHVPTGKAMGAPVDVDVKTFEVKLDGDAILVAVPKG